MEDQLRFFFTLSLKEIALRKVTVNLWNGPDVLATIGKCFEDSGEGFRDDSEEWRETVEGKVRDKLSELEVPISLNKEILQFIPPVGFQITKWKEFHKRYLELPDSEFEARILAKLCWTTSGTVDYQKTAKELIRCEMVDAVKRYQLASLYCLVDYIPVLWEALPEKVKKEFYNRKDIMNRGCLNLQFCWPYILKGRLRKLDYLVKKDDTIYTSFHHCAFVFAAHSGNRAASEYFFQKLTQEEKADSFIRINVPIMTYRWGNTADIFPSENLSDAFCFLLSHMNHEQHMNILQTYALYVLLVLMTWPSLSVISKNAHVLLAFLEEDDYRNLMGMMITYFGKYGRFFGSFFREFFRRSPANFKRLLVDVDSLNGFIFSILFEIEDSETIRVILTNIDVEDRFRLVSTKGIFNFFCKLLLSGRTHLVELCLREAALSNEDKGRLKKAFFKFVTSQSHLRKDRRYLQKKILQLLNEIGTSTRSKRSLEDESLDVAKKLHSDV